MLLNALYISSVTEYEAGWGQRPDGVVAAITKEALEAKQQQIMAGDDREQFWRCGAYRIAFVTEEFYDKVNQTEAKAIWANETSWIVDT